MNSDPNIIVHQKDEHHVYRVNLVKRTVEYTTGSFPERTFGITFENFISNQAIHFETIFGNFHLNKVRQIIKDGQIPVRSKTANEIIEYVKTHGPSCIDTDGELGVLIDAISDVIDRRLPR
jgi:hypothetical protein